MTDSERIAFLKKRYDVDVKLLREKLARREDTIRQLRVELTDTRHALRRFVPQNRIPKTEAPR